MAFLYNGLFKRFEPEKEEVDDTPVEDDDEELQAAFEMIKANIENASSRQYLNDLHKQNVALHNYVPYKEAMNKRYKEVK